MALLETRNLSKSFGGLQAIDKVSLKVEPNTIHGLIGPNGSGKSTFLRHLIGLKPPMQGDVSLFGESLYAIDELTRLRLLKGVGVAFQSGALLSSLSVGENVALPLVEHTALNREMIDLIVR